MAQAGTLPQHALYHPRGSSGGTEPAPQHEEFARSNIDMPAMERIFVLAGSVYLGIYAVEAPLRYVLFLAGKDSLILLRDGLIFGSLALLLCAQALRLRLHPAFTLFGTLLAFHGLVLIGTMGSIAGAAYGVKVLVNLLFGYFLAARLLQPSKRLFIFLALVWIVTLVGGGLDKFVMTFPWTGIKTVVGGIDVDVSRDWDIADPLSRRVAGFTRSSICIAVLLPPLAIILLSRVKRWLWRAALLIVTMGGVAITTQKGALAAFAPVALILLFPEGRRLFWLRLCCVGFLILAVGLPFLVMDLHMSHGYGVFSAASFYIRMAYSWPAAWQWIEHHQMLVFGVGLGGIGGSQRLYAPDNFNPADNMFILLYAYFGVFAIAYLLAIVYLVLRPATGSPDRSVTAVAILAFAFGYGAVLSMIEDQAAALLIGAAVGALMRESTVAVELPARRPSFAIPSAPSRF